jgi:hypothetical protein
VNRQTLLFLALGLGLARSAAADPPVASYLFPAGGQRGTTVAVRVGGLNLLTKAALEMLGPGVEASAEVRRMERVWFEGPLLPLPDSQQAEDYPQDYAATVTIAADAALGTRPCRVWNSQGAAGSLPFVVGNLPEVVEREADGDPVPTPVPLPLTINGRIFPREDVDLWTFPLSAGQVLTACVDAGRLGSPLDPWLEALGPGGRRIAEAAPAFASDARLSFVAPRDGTYTLKIHDVNVKGGQSYVYRLTLTTGPSIVRVFPLGGQRGARVSFTPEGIGVPAEAEAEPVSLPSAGAERGPEPVRVPFAAGGSAVVEIDDLPASLEAEPNDESAQASGVELPGVGDGRIGQAGDVDVWAVALEQGRTYVFDLRAARLGSSLDGLLSLTDAGGKELARAEGAAGRGGDPTLTYRAPATGRYFVRIRDRFRSRGGPAWAYRLRSAESPGADFRLTLLTDTLTLARGGSAKMKVEAERLGGFAGPIALDVVGLPEGTSVAKSVIAPNAGSADMVLKAEPGAAIRAVVVTVQGTAEIGGGKVVRQAARRAPPGLPEVDTLRLAVALPPPFVIKGPVDFGWSPRGSVHHRRYLLERNGFDGPVEVRLADRQARHLQGVTGPVLTVLPGADQFDYPVTMPPWMEIGRTSRAVVMAIGVVREPDGTEHEVSFANPRTELQVVSVVAPGLLGLEARRTSVAAISGKTLEVPVKVTRGKGVAGPVRIELMIPRWLHGLSAEPLILNEGDDEGILRIVCGRTVEPPRTAQTVLRATSTAADPVTAEAPLTVIVGEGR